MAIILTSALTVEQRWRNNMGLYVKGESKPDVCESCWFHVRWNKFEDLQCGLDDEKIIAMNTYEYKGQTAVPDWCPLVEVPESHGRLIDADELVEMAYKEETEGITFCVDSAEELEILFDDDAPTVIEANGE